MVIEVEHHQLVRYGKTSKDLFGALRDLEYTPFALPAPWPADYLCVPNTRLPEFRARFHDRIEALAVPSRLNDDAACGVTEQFVGG